jgi:ClpP class serine protease
MRQDVADQIGRLYRAGIMPTTKQLAEFRTARAARPKLATQLKGARALKAGDPANYAVIGNVAHIAVAGVLSEQPDFFAWLFGLDGTTYADIRDAFALAGADANVASARVRVSSPGGYVDGLFETLGAIQAFTKPISVVASMACSAAYAIAAQGGSIHAASPASQFGSVGVAAHYYIDPEHEVDIASTEAPKKRPDLSTEEGRAIVREELDALHELFVDAIAQGRRTTAENVNAEFGRGGVLLAGAALAQGMIDSVPSSLSEAAGNSANAVAAHDGGESDTEIMDKKTLKRTDPELYNSIVEEGRAEERARVKGHITLAKASDDWKGAHDDIENGAELTADVYARHTAAGINRRDKALRQQDSDEAGVVLNGSGAASAAADGQDFGDLVSAEFDRQRGKSMRKAG